MATVNSAKAALVNKIDSLTSSATAKDTIFLAKALKEGSNTIDTGTAGQVLKTNAAADGTEWVAADTFKTVGGATILGSGDIATLPSGGSVGQILKKDGSNNASWGTDEGGNLLQLVNIRNGTQYVTTSAGLVDTFSISITPTSATSKIYIIIDTNIRCDGAYNQYGGLGLKRDSSSLISETNEAFVHNGFDHRENRLTFGRALHYLDTPSTTSSITYTLQHSSGGTTNYMNYSTSDYSTITLMEIA